MESNNCNSHDNVPTHEWGYLSLNNYFPLGYDYYQRDRDEHFANGACDLRIEDAIKISWAKRNQLVFLYLQAFSQLLSELFNFRKVILAQCTQLKRRNNWYLWISLSTLKGGEIDKE